MPPAMSFVGRGAELGLLESALAGARRGDGRFVLVTGSAGIGKTTLVEALVARSHATTEKVQVGVGRAWEGAGAPPWWIWREALRPLGVELALPKTLADDEARFACLETVAEAVRDLAASSTVVIVLDDLQWADVSSLLTVKLLARSLATTPVLLLGTLRDPLPARGSQRRAQGTVDVDTVLADLRREAMIVPLGAFERADVAALVTGHGLDSAKAIDATLSISGGNPLLATRLLADAGARRELAGGRNPQLPSGLTSVVVRQLDQLEARERKLVEWASVAGEPLDLPLVVAASGLTAEELRSAVVHACEAGVLALSGAGPARFAHDLFRSAAYESIGVARRSEMHRAFARALAGRPDVESGIAEHLFAADPDDTSEEAAIAARAAARAAIARLAYEEAITMAERAVRADEHGGRPAPLAITLALLAEARLHAGDGPGSIAAAERALAIATKIDDAPEPYVRAALALGLRRMMGTSDPELVAALGEALARMERSGLDDVALQCAVEARLGSALQPMIDPARALTTARRAIERARKSGDPVLLARTIHQARPAFRLLEPYDERFALDGEMLSLAEGLRDKSLTAHARGRLHWLAIEAGDAISADLHLAEYERLATSLRVAQHEVGASSARAVRAAMCGDLDEAERVLARLEATHDQWSLATASFLPTALVMTIRAFIGTAHGDDTHVDAAMRTAPPRMRLLLELVFAARLGRREKAVQAFAVVAGMFLGAAEPGFIMRIILGEACVLLRDPTHAARLTELLAPWSGRHAVGTPLPVYYGSVDRLLAGFAALAGDAARAEQLYAAAIGAEESLGAFGHAKRTRSERAALLGASSRTNTPGSRASSANAARPPSRAVPALVCEGDTWLVRFGDEEVRIKDVVGLHYLAYLVARPDVPVTAVELFSTRAIASGDGDALGPSPLPSGSAVELLDTKAVASYRSRARDLREALDEATANNDRGTAELARHELDLIEHELRAAIGLGGRMRKSGAETERVRVGVTTRIRKAIERLRDRAPVTAHHLGTAVKTGTTCIYRPSPGP